MDTRPFTFALLGGGGWRAQFFLRAAQVSDSLDCVGLVVRDPAKAEAATARWGLPTWPGVAELLAHTTPEFLVNSISNKGRQLLDADLLEFGVPVLHETPAVARHLVECMREMYELHRQREAKVQVAEQFFLRPEHAARLCALGRGTLGEVGYAHVAVGHGIHGASLIRKYLDVGFEPFTVRAVAHEDRRAKVRDRGAPPTELVLANHQHQLALVSFANGKTGFFDWSWEYFTGIRPALVRIHAERGCIVNNDLTLMRENMDLIKLKFEVHAMGGDDLDGVLEGRYLKGIQLGDQWLYRNPFVPAPLHDDEIAVGDMLLRMGRYVRGGAPAYSFEDALQDQYLALCINRACSTGETVTATRQPWMEQGHRVLEG